MRAYEKQVYPQKGKMRNPINKNNKEDKKAILVEERSVAHPDEIEMGDRSLRTDLQNFTITNKIEELQDQIDALSHTVKAISETVPPQLPLIETDHPAEKNLTPMRRIFDFKKITRRGFLKLGGAIGLLLAGWSMTQRISIGGPKSHREKIELKDSNLARYARENGLSPEQIKKIRYFLDRGFDAKECISYFTFLEQFKVDPHAFNPITPSLHFQIYKEYFDRLRYSVPQDYLFENLNPIIEYGAIRKYPLPQLESLCRAFGHHRLREKIFDAIRTNNQLLNGLFDDFAELKEDSIQFYLAILQNKAAKYSYWDQEVKSMIQKSYIMEAIRDYGEDLGRFVISKEKLIRTQEVKRDSLLSLKVLLLLS